LLCEYEIDECECGLDLLFGIDSCLALEDAVRLTITETGYGTLGDLLGSARIADTVIHLERFKLQAPRRLRFLVMASGDGFPTTGALPVFSSQLVIVILFV